MQDFSESNGNFRYSLLADPESKIIKAFGLLNPNTRPGTLVHGMAFPGVYIVNVEGIVQQKIFNKSYRQRMAPETVLMKVYGVGEGEQRIEAEVKPQFKLKAYTSQDNLRAGNRFLFFADIDLYEKVHLYAPGSSYRAVDIKIADNPVLKVGKLKLPEPEMILLDVINETVPVYHGKVKINRELVISPHYRGTLINIDATLEYQTCDDELCYPPDKLPIGFEITLIPHDIQRAPEGVRHPEDPP